MPSAPVLSPPCPARDAVAGFLAGTLAEPTAEAVGRHLEGCPRCLLVADEVSRAGASELDTQLTRCLNAADLPPSAEYARMEAAAADICDRPVASTPAARDRPTDPGADARPDRVGRYDILGTIGRGGMGVVYRARHRWTQRVVALKMLGGGRRVDPGSVRRFRVEGAAVARLDHPNIARLYDFDEAADGPYYTMELVDGPNLAARLRSAAAPYPFREAANLVRTAAAAVDYAHSRHVIHRDLKPANILVGADGVPKVTDFGLAKFLDGTSGAETGTDDVLGTPAYMAPEQAAGSVAGPPADVYALGAILYELLTGRPPFAGATKLDTIRRVREDLPEPPTRHRPDVPPGLEAVCLRCLEKTPAARYASASDLAADLGRWLGGAPTVARRPGFARRVARAVRSRARAVAVGCLVFGCGVVAAIAIPAGRPPGRGDEAQLAALQSALGAGNPAVLVDATGPPRWHRWAAGVGRSQAAVEPDGVFAVHTQGTALLELVPDPMTDCYRFAARVRHDRGGYPGEVGLYVGRTSVPGVGEFFTQAAFNGVRGRPDPVGKAATASDTPAVLRPCLLPADDARSAQGYRFDGVSGPRVAWLGERSGRWYDVAIDVTPAGVTLTLDGSSVTLPAGRLTHAVAAGSRLGDATLPVPALPPFNARGGLGIVVWRGSAAVCDVAVTPTTLNPDSSH